jgi:alpha-N-arabinofuranosidase
MGTWELGQLGRQENAVRCREWAKAIKRLDPSLKVLAVGCYEPKQAVDWNLAVPREAWECIDLLTLHTYWPFDRNADGGDYERVLSGPYRAEAAIEAIQGLVDLVARERPGTPKPMLAFTEWNCADATRFEMSPTWRPSDPRFRTVDALAVASFLNAMQRQCAAVGLANFAQTINVPLPTPAGQRFGCRSSTGTARTPSGCPSTSDSPWRRTSYASTGSTPRIRWR